MRIREKYKKEYYQANKERIKAKTKSNVLKGKTSKTIVYLLPKENYVGITNNLKVRLSNQRVINKRDTTDYRILAEVNTRAEALELESLIHSIGYSGACEWNTNRKKYI
mgnify:FL=1